jgi:predicted dehydrogenase
MERRKFIEKSALTGAGLALSKTFGSYSVYAGTPSDKVRMALVGTNSRGLHVGKLFAQTPNVEITWLCDIDTNVISKSQEELLKLPSMAGKKLKSEKDIRKIVVQKDVDAIMVATPDHWHAPAAILAASNKKHCYLEKPCAHNPAEGEMLVKAKNKHGVVIQVGNQRRSFPGVKQMIADIQSGIIGNVYLGKAWYANNRKAIGTGKTAPIPANIDWELWQGPAPRKDFHDNYVHYNWHWFWHWGTGEALNNGTHELDVLRWGMGLEFPSKVSSTGGRYQWKDDWETPDTQLIQFQFGSKATIEWEGRSCNNFGVFGSGRGTIFYGEKGTIVYPGGDAYTVYDYDGKVIKEVKEGTALDLTNTISATAGLDQLHVQNFVEAVRGKETITSNVEEAVKSTLLPQLGNIAFRTEKTLLIDTITGKPKDEEALKLWGRTYENGWEPKF